MSWTPYARKSESIVALGDSKPVGTGSVLQELQATMAKAAAATRSIERTSLLLPRYCSLSNY
jgi:hypothetical protein